jgi:DNA-binding transcriptional LysR family regulator
MSMRLEKIKSGRLESADYVCCYYQEKSITAAASRLFLSQPAVSRALQRARAMFQDDLLVRSPNGFELTLRGLKMRKWLISRVGSNRAGATRFSILGEAPQARREAFDPDNVCTVVLLRLCLQSGEKIGLM